MAVMNVYPHPELPLLPRGLIALVEGCTIESETVPARPAADLAQLTPSDFAPAELHQIATALADMVQGLLQSRRHEKWLAQTHLDASAGIRLAELALTERAKVSLQARPFFDASGRWRNASLLSLVRDHGIGARLLMALMLAIEASRASARRASAAAPACIEEELESIAAEAIFSSRSLDVFMRLSGWHGRGREAMGDVARSYGITSERARQIHALAGATMRRRAEQRQAPRFIRRAIGELSVIVPCTAADAADALVVAHIAREPFHPAGVLVAADVFGITHQLELHSRGDQNFVVCAGQWPLLQHVQRAVFRMLRRYGVVNVDRLAEDMVARRQLADRVGNVGVSGRTQAPRFANLEQAQRFSQLALWSTPQMQRLDESGRWGWLPGSRNVNGILGRIVKVLGFAGAPVHLDELELALAKPGSPAARLAMPREVLIGLLRQTGFKVENDLVHPQQGEAALHKPIGNAEYLMADLLRQHGPRMPKDEFQRLCEDAGVNPHTFLAHLRGSPLIAVDTQQICRLVTHGT